MTDHLGSTAGLTDASGTVVEQFAYDSFGNNGGSTGTRYTNRKLKMGSGLMV